MQKCLFVVYIHTLSIYKKISYGMAGFFLFAFTASFFSVSAQQIKLDSGLVAHLPMDGNADDISGNGNHGVVSGSTALTPDEFGRPDSAYYFPNGILSYINIPDAPSLDFSANQQVSVSLFINPTQWEHFDVIINKWGTGNGPDDEFNIKIDNTGKIRTNTLDFFDFWGGFITTESDETIPLNQWTHFATTWDANSDIVRLYINGLLVKENYVAGFTTNSYLQNTNEPIIIGNDNYHDPGENYGGSMDELRFYNRTLTEPEVLEIYVPRPKILYTPACEGENANVVAAGDFTKKWYSDRALNNLLHTGDTFKTSNFSITYPDSLYVTQTRGTTEGNIVAIELTEKTKPSIGFSADTFTICPGDRVFLDPGYQTSYTYLWQDNSTDSIFVANTSGTYHVTVTDTNGCWDRDTALVGMEANLGDLIAEDTSVYCPGGSDTLTMAGNPAIDSITWFDPGNAIIAKDVFQVTGNPSQEGFYRAEVFTINGCRYTDSLYLRQATPPNVEITHNGIQQDTFLICPGGSIIPLVAESDTSYNFLWQDSSHDTVFMANDTGVYHVTVTDTNGCQGVDTVEVTFEDTIGVLLPEDTVFYCPGDPVTLSIDSNSIVDTITWNAPPPVVFTDTTFEISFVPIIDGIYSVDVLTQAGCAYYGEVFVNASNPPVTEILGNGMPKDTFTLCPGVPGIELAPAYNSAYQYLWQNGNTDSVFYATDSGTYHVTVTNTNGCSSSDTVRLQKEPSLSDLIAEDNSVYCPGNADTLVINNSPTIDSIIWYDPALNTFGINAAEVMIPSPIQGKYLVEVFSINECRYKDSLILDAGTPPIVDISVDGVTKDTFIICKSATINLDPGYNSSYAYLWQNNDTNSVFVASDSGKYHVTVTDTNGCSGYDTVSLELQDTPGNLILEDTSSHCPGSPDTLTLEAGPLIDSVNWLAPDNTALGKHTPQIIFIPAQVGFYKVEVFTVSGCFFMDSIYVLSDTVPVIDILGDGIQKDTFFLCNSGASSVRLVADNNPVYNYRWQDDSADSVFIADTSGTYYVMVSNENGCKGYDNAIVVFEDTIGELLEHDTAFYCPGDPVTLSIGQKSIMNTITWTKLTPPPFAYPDDTSSITVNPANPSRYEVTVETINGCMYSDEIYLKEGNIPNVNISGNGVVKDTFTICNTNIKLSAGNNEAYNYHWNNGVTDSVIYAAPGTYHVTVTDTTSGCYSADTVTVQLEGNITTLLSQDSTTWCPGDTVFLSIPDYSSIDSIKWYDTASNLIAHDTTAISLPIPATGFYAVEIETQAGCTVTDSIFVKAGIEPCVAIKGNGSVSDTLEICDTSVLLYAAMDTTCSYVWQDGSTNRTLLVSDSGSYHVTATNSDGCTNADTVYVRFEGPKPNLINQDTMTFCPDDIISLSVDSSYSFVGFGLEYGHIGIISFGAYHYTFMPFTNGLISVEAISQSGCHYYDSVYFIRDTIPNINILGDGVSGDTFHICKDSIELNPGYDPDYEYEWHNGSTDSIYWAFTTGMYKVTATYTGACQAVDSVYINKENSISDLIISDSLTYCLKDTISLFIVPDSIIDSVAWYDPNMANIGSDQQLISFVPQLPGWYKVDAYTYAGCIYTDSIYLTQTIPPNIEIMGDSIYQDTFLICNDPIVLDPGYNSAYSYTWQDGVSDSLYKTGAKGMYHVTVTDANGCNDSDTVWVQLEGNIFDLLPQDTIKFCPEEQISLSYLPNQSIDSVVWYNNNKDIMATDSQQINMSPTQPGYVYLDVFTNAGCFYQDSALLMQHPLLAINIFGDTTVYRHQANVTYRGISSSDAVFTWSVEGANAFQPYRSADSLRVDWGIVSPGIVHLQAKDNQTGCTVYDTLEVEIAGKGPLRITDSIITHVSCYGEHNGAIVLIVQGGEGEYTYSWDGYSINDSILGGLGAGQYHVTISDTAGTQVLDSFNVAQPDSLRVIVNTWPVVCYGDSIGRIELDVSGGTQPYAYTWAPDISNNDLAYNLSAGNYQVTITGQHNCPAKELNISVASSDQITITDTLITRPSCPGKADGAIEIMQLTGGSGGYDYYWSNNVTNPVNTDLEPGAYSCSITDKEGCSRTFTFNLEPQKDACFFIPNAFSPNGDGANDTWRLESLYNNFPYAKVYVYDREGRLVFYSEEKSNYWDGTVNGKMLPLDSYHYIIHPNDDENDPILGQVTILY